MDCGSPGGHRGSKCPLVGVEIGLSGTGAVDFKMRWMQGSLTSWITFLGPYLVACRLAGRGY